MINKDKKGFTLVEIIAVITVISILSLLVLPLILNQVRSKKNQANEAMLNSINAAALLYVDNNRRDYIGEANSCIKISTLVENDYLDTSIYDYDDFDLDLKDAFILTESVDTKAQISLECNSKYNLFDNGTVIYFNPETNKICEESEVKSKTGQATGCMKWFAFNDSINLANVNLILDHNIVESIMADTTANLIKAASDSIKDNTTTWNDTIRDSARIIGANEIAAITGADKTISWQPSLAYSDIASIGSTSFPFYFDGKSTEDKTWQTRAITTRGGSKYAWLYDNTNCSIDGEEYGCSVVDNNLYDAKTIDGYVTNTSLYSNTKAIWVVDSMGKLTSYDLTDYTKNYGIRPVISIPKSIIK